MGRIVSQQAKHSKPVAPPEKMIELLETYRQLTR
jgi:hypothetical protein